MNNNEPYLITARGKWLLDRRMAKLHHTIKKLREEKHLVYKGCGDTWQDNPAYADLDQQEQSKLRELENLCNLYNNCKLVQHKPRNTTKISIGSLVYFTRTPPNGGKPKRLVYEIVGFDESRVDRYKVSWYSPIGQTLQDLAVGDSERMPDGSQLTVLRLFATWNDARRFFGKKLRRKKPNARKN